MLAPGVAIEHDFQVRAGQPAIGLHEEDKGAFNPAGRQLRGVGGLEGGESDWSRFGAGVQLRSVERPR